MDKFFIKLGQIDIKLILLIIFIALNTIFTYNNYLFGYDQINSLIDKIEIVLGEILGGIAMPYIIKHKENLRKNKKNLKESIKDWLIFFLLALAMNVSTFFANQQTLNETSQIPLSLLSLGSCWEAIIIFLVTSFFMKNKYYLHHILSLIIFCITCIAIDLILEYYSGRGLSLLYFFICDLMESLAVIYMKYLMDSRFKQYWHLLLAMGLINVLMTLASFVISIIRDKNNGTNDTYDGLSEYFTSVGVGYIILRFIVMFLFNGILGEMMRYVLMKNYTINHLLIGGQLAILVVDCQLIDNYYKYFCMIPFVIQIFSLLIYLEILECNFCGLNKNTKKNIQLRAIREEIKDEILDNKIELTSGYIVDEEKNNNNKECDYKENGDLETPYNVDNGLNNH